MQQAHFTGTVLNLKIKVTAGAILPFERFYSSDYVFRFYIEGINAICGSITKFDAQSNAMGLPVNLFSGVTCAGKNYFHFQSHMYGQSFHNTLGLNSDFDTG